VNTTKLSKLYLLFFLCLVPVLGWAEYTEGVEYIQVPTQPTDTGSKVEVREFFWFGCPHCYHLEPTLQAWLKTLSPKAQFVRTPAVLRPDWEAHGRAYYAFEALGVSDKMDAAFFKALHEQHRDLSNEETITAFAVENGIDKSRFRDAYNSFGMATNLRHAAELQKAYNLSSVPTMVVAGKYVTNASIAGGQEELMKVLDYLIDKAAKAQKHAKNGKSKESKH
jgi:thiol:disulfide interchange protein DsbA